MVHFNAAGNDLCLLVPGFLRDPPNSHFKPISSMLNMQWKNPLRPYSYAAA